MKILITGSNLNALLTAQYIKTQNPDFDIYVTTNNEQKNETYTPVNIEENNINELKNFVKYNNIDFTISMSGLSIINGITDVFKRENLPIFSPAKESARVTFFNSIAKKIMYKNKINTPRFGIFDRENIALDYVRNINYPIDILNDFTLIERTRTNCKSYSKAKEILQKIYENSNEKIIIENYVDSAPLNIYFITDGFNALPLAILEKEIRKDYTAIHSPSEKISEEILISILHNAIYPLLDDISKYTDSYSGILGLKIKFSENKYTVLEFLNNFEPYDIQPFLSLLNEDFCSILYDTATGALADNYNYIKLEDKHSFTLSINKNKLNNLDSIYEEDDFFISDDKENIIITGTALTFNSAKNKVLNLIKPICGNEIYQKIAKEEIKV